MNDALKHFGLEIGDVATTNGASERFILETEAFRLPSNLTRLRCLLLSQQRSVFWPLSLR